MNQSNQCTAEIEFVVTRVFDAPRELVWQAWTEAERLAQWWGPKGPEVEVKSLDFRPGGLFHYSMKSANGSIMWGKFVYGEMNAPERLIFTSSFADENGNTARAPFFDGKWPLEILTTVTFVEENGQTTLILRAVPINATETEQQAFIDLHSSMQQGYGGTMEQLADYLLTQSTPAV